MNDNIIKDKVCYPDHPTQLGYMHKFLLVTLKRQPEACIGAQLQKDTFKDSLIFFFIIPCAQTPNSSRTSTFLTALNIYKK